jgi:macrodomain Ter protein organizer (MatP/YcbG family)
MSLLSEYTLNPDVFDIDCYGKSSYSCEGKIEICGVYLKTIVEILLEEALLRDLYNGEWKKFVKQIKNGHPNTKYILKDLVKQRRLRLAEKVLQDCPLTYKEWCDEALESHKQESLDGIITAKEVAKEFKIALVSSIERLDRASWWNNRSSSVRLYRTTSDYINYLKLIFCHANSLMFIDPYLDPVKFNYREFGKILAAIPLRDTPPVIEVHLCHLESITFKEYENDFRQTLSNIIQPQNLEVKVFIWDNFHDRHLISDIIGINLNQGFDISDKPNEKTTWTRLGRSTRDDIQREFDPASKQHKLQYQFEVS